MTVLLILANIAAFAWSSYGVELAQLASFAVVPNELLSQMGWATPVGTSNDAIAVPEQFTLISYMFLHADILHLGGNMLFLWVFGDNVEDAVGHVKFLVFYLLCGIVAGLVHAAMLPESPVPLVGASGATAGVVAAYLMLHPNVRLWVLAFNAIPLQISAMWALGAWIVYQFAMVVYVQPGPVAWWAHIGGLVAGAALILVLRKPGVYLFDRGLRSA